MPISNRRTNSCKRVSRSFLGRDHTYLIHLYISSLHMDVKKLMPSWTFNSAWHLPSAKMFFVTFPFLVELACLLPFVCPASSSRYRTTDKCKATPLSPSWPSRSVWYAFNVSVSGQLLAPLTPASVCDASLSVFNEVFCERVASLWNVSDFHAADPVSVDQVNWENDACLPSLDAHCDLQQFPRFVVNATEAMHVKRAIDFARERNVRLIVKGTGHDFLGRYVHML